MNDLMASQIDNHIVCITKDFINCTFNKEYVITKFENGSLYIKDDIGYEREVTCGTTYYPILNNEFEWVDPPELVTITDYYRLHSKIDNLELENTGLRVKVKFHDFFVKDLRERVKKLEAILNEMSNK